MPRAVALATPQPEPRAWDGQLDIRLDEATQTLEIRCGGNWSMEDTLRYAQRTRVAVDATRARYGRVKVLIDAATGITQPPESIAHIQRMDTQIYRPADRIAIVVSSSLMKMQSKRVEMCATKEAFISRHAATTWLQAYS
jgi:hypothetical protein